MIETVGAFGIFFAHGWKDEWSEEWQADLTAVGVSGEDEIYEVSFGVGHDGVDVVGFVRHEDDGCVRLGGNGEVDVGVAGAGVFEATKPEALAAFFDGYMLVDEDRCASAGEGLGDQGGVAGDVVVAKNGVAQRSSEGGDDFSAFVGSMIEGDEGEGAVGDEISGNEDEIRGERVHLADDVLEKEGLGVLVEVDVADLDDPVSMERRREIGDGDSAKNDIELVTGDFTGVEGHACCDGA